MNVSVLYVGGGERKRFVCDATHTCSSSGGGENDDDRQTAESSTIIDVRAWEGKPSGKVASVLFASYA